MAKGSQTGWFGMPKEKRFCVGCREAITLNPKKDTTPDNMWRYHLVFREIPVAEVWHHNCLLKAERERAANK